MPDMSIHPFYFNIQQSQSGIPDVVDVLTVCMLPCKVRVTFNTLYMEAHYYRVYILKRKCFGLYFWPWINFNVRCQDCYQERQVKSDKSWIHFMSTDITTQFWKLDRLEEIHVSI